MLIIKTLAGDEIGRCRAGFDQWENLCDMANERLLDKLGYIPSETWKIEDVYEDDGYPAPIEFMTLDGIRYFVVEEGE